MSVNYVDKSTGDLIRVAGQGTAEYGASTVRKGTFTGTDNGTGLINITVTFDSPMPDADYLVDITDVSSVENFWVSVAAKTKNGFALYLRKSTGGSSITVNGTYTAFKLYTDTEYNNLLNNAVLTSDVTDAVTNGDMNPVTSNAVYDALETVSTMSITKQGNYINGTNFHGKKIGKVAVIEINGDTGSSIPWQQIITVGIATGSATPLTELKCTADMLSITTGYYPNGNAITTHISPYCRAWIGAEGNIQVFLANPGASDTSYTGNIFIGGSYITQ